MINVKVYDTDTGHVETVNSYSDTEADKANELLDGLNVDPGTETVYYVSTEPS